MNRVLAALFAGLAAGALVPHAAADEADQAALARKALAVLKKNCAQCHGPNSKGEGGLKDILDVKKLIEAQGKDYIIPGNPGKSYVFQRIKDGEMPPDEKAVTSRPSDEDVALLKEWITAGAPAAGDAVADRKFIGPDEMLAAMKADLEAMRRTKDRTFIRYFTLTHLYNAGVPDEQMETYRVGLSLLVNSLSLQREIHPPTAIDPANTIYRIDLRDYQWTADTWNSVLALYPYGVKRDDETAQFVYSQIGTDVPAVQADWFVFTASRPPLYHTMLNMPETVQELEARLHVDVAANLDNEKYVARAGFNGSGVSENNRLLERHPMDTGAYYRSRDFASNSDIKNLFEHPLDFQEDGGEIIFSLPNGLQAYMLVNGQGQRIDKGPTNIVHDKTSRTDPSVINGISCMSCHSDGMIPKSDQVRAAVEKTKAQNANAFSDDDYDTILALYKPKEVFSKYLEQDGRRFREAAAQCGVPVKDKETLKLKSPEPIRELAFYFEGEMNLAQAAAELGLTPDAFRKLLEDNADLARAFGSLSVVGGTVKRDQFAQRFADLVTAAGVGTAIPAADATALTPPLVTTGAAARLVEQARKALDGGDRDKALDLLNQALTKEPDSAAAHEGRGDLRKGDNDLDGAIADYTAASDKDPLNTGLATNLAGALDDRGLSRIGDKKFADAIADLEKAHDLASTDAAISLHLAEAYEGRADEEVTNNQDADAISDLKRALEVLPDDALLHADLGRVYVLDGDFDAAIDEASAAIDKDPNLASAYKVRGAAYAKRGGDGDADRAQADFDKADELDKDK
jgi:tetratricopeptide (TPR) repeat protein/mono/diheme cytochrome c family protein